jgi:hypothetical protein
MVLLWSKVQGSSWWLVYYTVDCIWHKDEKRSKSEMQGIVSAKIMATHRNRKCTTILAMDSGGTWCLPVWLVVVHQSTITWLIQNFRFYWGSCLTNPRLELEGRYSTQQIRALVPLFVDRSHPSIKHDGVTSVKTEIQQKSSFVRIWAF